MLTKRRSLVTLSILLNLLLIPSLLGTISYHNNTTKTLTNLQTTLISTQQKLKSKEESLSWKNREYQEALREIERLKSSIDPLQKEITKLSTELLNRKELDSKLLSNFVSIKDLRTWLSINRVDAGIYNINNYNCENFAKSLATAGKASGHYIGLLGLGYHALNFVILGDKTSGYSIYQIEPQTDEITFITGKLLEE